MAAFQVIYVVAASLWIFVVLAALCIGCRFMAKLHNRRRRISRLFDVVRVPNQIGTRGVLFLRWCERACRPYGDSARKKVAFRLQTLISEFRPDGRAARPSASRRLRRRNARA
jgi:hypothetical protein